MVEKYLEEHYDEIFEEYSKRHPEHITSDFILEEDGNWDYIEEIVNDLYGKDKIDDLVLTGIILGILFIITFATIFGIAIHNMIIDHKCYKLPVSEFYSTEMCKPYWKYRQVGKK